MVPDNIIFLDGFRHGKNLDIYLNYALEIFYDFKSSHESDLTLFRAIMNGAVDHAVLQYKEETLQKDLHELEKFIEQYNGVCKTGRTLTCKISGDEFLYDQFNYHIQFDIRSKE